MPTYAEVVTILQNSFGQEEGLIVMEYFESRIPPDVARQRDLYEVRDTLATDIHVLHENQLSLDHKISETEASLRLEIEKVRLEVEKVRADLGKEIEQVRADLGKEIEQVRADLTKEIEKMRADLTKEIEKMRADLAGEIEKVRADLTKEIEKVRADLTVEISRSQSIQTRWAFLFWVSQLAVLLAILFRLIP
jgi:hypothetical protein